MTAQQPGGRVGIVVAMPSEARALGVTATANEIIDFGDRALVYLCGIGPANARRATAELIAAGIGGAVSWGIAGGLITAAVPGDLLLPDTVVGDDAAYETDRGWRERLLACLRSVIRVRGGAMYSGPTLINGAADKKRLADDTGTAAVDMESAAIAEQAARAGLPFVCIRAIVDPVSLSLPPALVQSIDEAGFVSIPTALRLLTRRPADIVPVLQVAAHFRRATATLRSVAREAGPGLLGP